MEDIFNKFINGIIDFGFKLILVAIVILIGFKIVNIFEKYLRKEHKFEKMDESAKGFIVSFIAIALKCIVVVMCISILGVSNASIVAAIGSCGVAIGLALQGGLSNIAGGVMILIFKPFKVGNYIMTDNGYEGTVKSITMFYTIITTVDNKLIMIPNGILTSSTVTNFTGAKKRRVDIDLSVSYNTDIDKVKKVVSDILEKHELILENEQKVVRVKEHADSALIFTVRVWAKTDDYWNVKFDLLEQIKEAFDKNKIEIPYPQLDINMKEKKVVNKKK